MLLSVAKLHFFNEKHNEKQEYFPKKFPFVTIRFYLGAKYNKSEAKYVYKIVLIQKMYV